MTDYVVARPKKSVEDKVVCSDSARRNEDVIGWQDSAGLASPLGLGDLARQLLLVLLLVLVVLPTMLSVSAFRQR